MSKTIEEEIQDLRDQEEENYKIAEQNGEEYQMKSFEILEGEIREVEIDEYEKCKRDPRSFPESVQRKYFGRSEKDWEFRESVDPKSEVPPGYVLDAWIVTNPYTKEERTIYEHRELPKPTRENVLEALKAGATNDAQGHTYTGEEIGDVITARVFDGNPYAQGVLNTKAWDAKFRQLDGIKNDLDKEIIEKRNRKTIEVNRIREIFGLSPM